MGRSSANARDSKRRLDARHITTRDHVSANPSHNSWVLDRLVAMLSGNPIEQSQHFEKLCRNRRLDSGLFARDVYVSAINGQ